jgi:hypothetical protein
VFFEPLDQFFQSAFSRALRERGFDWKREAGQAAPHRVRAEAVFLRADFAARERFCCPSLPLVVWPSGSYAWHVCEN